MHTRHSSSPSTAIVVGIVFLFLLVGGGIFREKIHTFFENVHLFSQSASPRDGSIPNEHCGSHCIVYGYLPYWTRSTAYIAPELTHVSFFSLGIAEDGHVLSIPTSMQQTGYRMVKNGVLDKLRQEIGKNQKLELSLTMMDQQAIPIFVACESARQAFVKDVEILLETTPITGIHIDVEYNGLVDQTLQQQFADLLKDTQKVVKAASPANQLTVATYSDAGSLTRLTNLEMIDPYVDHIVMMSYDYHRRISLKAGPNAPLYGKNEGKWAADITTDLREYTRHVAPQKILLGIPFYGYQWQIQDADDPNSFTLPNTAAVVTYEHIQTLLRTPGVRRNFDPFALTPYLRFDTGSTHYVLYYEDPESLRYKLELVRQAGLGGIAIWTLGYDGPYRDMWQTVSSFL